MPENRKRIAQSFLIQTMNTGRVLTPLSAWPRLGCGLGLRAEHYNTILRTWPKEVDWFEAITENYMDSGGRPLQILEKVRSHYPVGLHGVSLSIGSCDPLNRLYLNRLKALAERIEPAIISDHLCWTGVKQKNVHDLLPLPFTEEALKHIVTRVSEIQDFLNRKILLENVSSYLTFKHSHIPEWDFLSEISRQSGCGILLDINNVYVNAKNHNFDPYLFLNSIPLASVGQFHLAGHTSMGKYLFDTHNGPVIDEVWILYQYALKRFGKVTTLIEWDADIPEFPELVKEADKARKFFENTKKNKINIPSELTAATVNQTVKKSKTPTLAQVQHLFEKCVLPHAKESSAKSRIAKILNSQGGDPGEKRLSVYADGYITRIYESLSEAYPAIKHIVGEQAFIETAFDYSTKYPSKHYNLGQAGKHYSLFLKKASLAKNLSFLPDLAALEWKVAKAFHAFDLPAADLARLGSLSDEDRQSLTLELQPSVDLVSSSWPIVDLWNARTEPLEKIHIQLEKNPQKALVYKNNMTVYCELISREQYLLLQDLFNGKTLETAMSRFTSLKNTSQFKFSEWFSGWVQKKLITDYSIVPAKLNFNEMIAHEIQQ